VRTGIEIMVGSEAAGGTAEKIRDRIRLCQKRQCNRAEFIRGGDSSLALGGFHQRRRYTQAHRLGFRIVEQAGFPGLLKDGGMDPRS
jgi:hypothetical protein